MQVDPLNAAINISRLLPINRQEDNINIITELLYNDDDALNEFLQKVEQPLIVNEDGFICCEYNRDGDSYRFPGTDKYYPEIENGVVPNKDLLRLERILYNAFTEYLVLYYQPKGTSTINSKNSCSVYCYQLEEDNVNDFAVAILIKNQISDKNSKINYCQWESTNLITVSKLMDQYSYDLITTINLTLSIKSSKSNTDVLLTGSVNKNKKIEKDYDDEIIDMFHVINIGELVETMETDLLSQIQNIYFNKTNQIINELRHEGSLNKVIK